MEFLKKEKNHWGKLKIKSYVEAILFQLKKRNLQVETESFIFKVRINKPKAEAIFYGCPTPKLSKTKVWGKCFYVLVAFSW